MTESQLVSALVESPVPRPDALARDAASRLFPTWQAVVVGAPIAVILAALLGCLTALAIALPLGLVVVDDPKPAWFGHVSEAAMLPGVSLGIWLVVRWMRRRRAAFTALAREGEIVAAYDVAASSLVAALATRAGAAIVRAALRRAVGRTVAQAFGGPIAAAELDGKIIEARTVADARGRFRVPEMMLADRAGGYVALLHRGGWIAPQRVLRRRIRTAAGLSS
jgi:hypothetical protein